ncbi:MAG: hypothetical protein IPJ82_03270 [Lewinellaceae bacterium]|nr:hypothetical protein [Lewinellaceae bacterium]
MEVTNAALFTSFSWSTGSSASSISVSAPGIYSVTVSVSGGCTATGSFTVGSSNANFNISGTTAPVTSCVAPNGVIDISVTPSGTYTYNWSNGTASEDINNLPSGSYTVTITETSGGCTSSASFTVSNNTTSPLAIATPVAATCNQSNGSVNLSVSPAGTYTYNWSNGATDEDIQNLAPGIYSVTVTGTNGCTSTTSAVVANNSAPFTLTSTVVPNTSCTVSNGSIDITVSTAGTFTYLWSNNATTEDLQDLAPGTYSVTVSGANGCTSTTSAVVANNSAPFTLTSTVVPNTSCTVSNGSIDITVSTAGTFTYLWSNNATTEDLQNLAPGTYSVTATGTNGCTSTTSAVVANNSAPFTLTSTAVPNTSCTVSNGSIDITVSTAGTFTYLWSNNATTEDLQNLAPGTYSVTATGTNGCISTTSAVVANNSALFTLTSTVVPNTSCTVSNGSIDITVSTAGTFTYLWSNNATTEDLQDLAPGTYSVTATGTNGCTSTTSAVVANNSAPFTLTSTAVPNTSCTVSNGSIDITVSTAGTFTYLWSNNATTEDLQDLAPGTYSVTATGTNGCTSTTSAVVANNSAPFTLTSTIVPNTSCTVSNGSIDITVSTAGTFTYLWSNNATTEDLQDLAPGTYSVTATGTNGCTSTTSAVVANNSAPFTLTSTVVPNTSCTVSNGSIDITVSTAGTFTYLWSNNATTEDLQNLAPGTYSVTATGTNGCTSTTSAVVANNSAPFTLTSTAVPNTSCTVSNGSIDITVSTAGTFTYLWSNNATTEDLQDLAPGTYSVTATGTNGCTSTTSAVVANNSALFTLTSTVVPNTSCTVSNGSIDITVSTAGTFTYLWSNNATTEDLQDLAPGTYSVTVSGANGCTSVTSAVVANNSALFTLTSTVVPNTSCTVSNGSIDITVSTAGTFTYLWSNNATTEDLQDLAPGTYSVTVSGANGCTSTTSAVVANNSAPFTLASTVVPNTSCTVSNGSIDITVSTAGTFTYLWSNNATTEDLQDLAPGTYSVTATGANGCISTTSAVVANNSAPFTLASTVVPNTSCTVSNGSIDITVSTAGTFTYLWSNNATTEDLQDLAPGTYSVTVSGANGCTSTVSALVPSNILLPAISLTTTPSSCGQSNGAVTLVITSGSAPFVYLWSNGNTVQNIGNAAAGNYAVTVVDANGCTQTESTIITNNGLNFSISANTIPNNSCTQPSGAIDLSVSAPGSYSYSWSNNAGSQDLNGLPAGTYSVTVSDNLGCSLSGVYTISENTSPPEIQVVMTPVDCNNPTGSIQIELVQGGTPPLEYSIDGGQHFYTEPMFEQLAPGNYQVMVADANDCSTELSVYIPKVPVPIIAPLPDFALQLGATQTLIVQLPAGFPLSQIDTVIWSPDTGLEFSGTSIQQLLRPTILGIENQQFTVTIITKQGCEAQATFRVDVDTKRSLYAPNVIWPEDPNGDNSAFTLFTRPGSLREILVLKIFDRWGDELFSREHFEPDNLKLGWQGDYRGQPMNPGVFVWWAEVEWVDGKRTEMKGDVTVVR